jgi:hypothetical protein
MKLHGSIEDNLVAAVRSARRFRVHPVHADTLRHWDDLLQHARRELASAGEDRRVIEPLIVELETEIAARPR